jgi:small subunit ribosomal protein S14
MAKRSKIVAERRRQEVVARYVDRRAELKARIRAAAPGSAELVAAVQALARLPRDSSPVRLRNRDQVDGRPRGYLRKAGVSRIRFREMAHRGELPGITKSSW